jgi:RNA polymerase sigma factor for flagellar operon FliA
VTRRTLGWLWSRYFEARDALEGGEIPWADRRNAERELRVLRERLVVHYSPLVKYAARRVSARAICPVETDEVLSWGVFGLLEAVETYDPGRQTKFESYAISKIRWAILDELRRLDPLTRRVRRRAREAESARARLAQRLGRTPAEEEVARELGVGIADHRAFLEGLWRAQVGSFEARLECGDGPGRDLHQLVADGRAADPESAVEAAEVRARLVQAIRTLGEKERVVTTFYYYDGLTLKEIGGAMNLTEGRISQILHKALAKLREALEGSPEPTGRL